MERRFLRRVPLARTDPEAAGGGTRRTLEQLDEHAALRLLSEVPYGRIVFVRDGEPEIRPLNHIVDDGEVVVRTHLGAALADALVQDGRVKASFEADLLNSESRAGWSVVVSGTAAVVDDPARRARCQDLLRPWLDKSNDTVIAIRPSRVTGFRLVPANGTATAPASR